MSKKSEIEQVKADLEKRIEEMEDKTDAQLRKIIADAFRLTREHLLDASAAVAALDRRKVKPVDAPEWFLRLARKIASGEWFVDTVLRFGDDAQIMSKLARLPIPEQQQLLQMPDQKVREYIRQAPSAPSRQKPDVVDGVFDQGNGMIRIVVNGTDILLAAPQAETIARAVLRMCKKAAQLA